MKRWLRLVLVLLLLLCAAGCRDAQPQPTETTAPPKPTMTARELYWKMRNALGMKRPTCYTTEMTIFYESGSGIFRKEEGHRTRMQVIFQKEPYAINIAYEWTEYAEDEELTTGDVFYYREKDDGVDVHYYSSSMKRWFYRDEEGIDRSVLMLGGVTLHPTKYSENMTLDAETQMVGDREAYVLRYREPFSENQNGMELTGDQAILKDLEAENRLYVDTQTYMLLQAEMELRQLEGDEAKAMYSYAMGEGYPNQSRDMTVTSYTTVYRNLNYEPVEVPPVPQEAFKAAAGLGTT